MSNEQEQLINYKNDLLSVMRELIDLFNDMVISSRENYMGKLYPVRELFVGYLLLCRDNLKATILLLENNLGHQLYFISRNIFEMAVTLFYILDEESKTSERVDRYFEYNNSFKRQLGSHMLSKLQKLGFGNGIELDVEEIEQNCKAFKEKYGKDGKLRVDNWSGMNTVQMIESFSEESVREEFLDAYEIGVKSSNSILHPTRFSLRQAIDDYFSGEINYRFQLGATSEIAGLSAAIADKFLTQFPKGRPIFAERLEGIRSRLQSFLPKYKGLHSP